VRETFSVFSTEGQEHKQPVSSAKLIPWICFKP
jgi:hypothetical protein